MSIHKQLDLPSSYSTYGSLTGYTQRSNGTGEPIELREMFSSTGGHTPVFAIKQNGKWREVEFLEFSATWQAISAALLEQAKITVR